MAALRPGCRVCELSAEAATLPLRERLYVDELEGLAAGAFRHLDLPGGRQVSVAGPERLSTEIGLSIEAALA